MGRFRTFANDEQKDFNHYYNKKNGETIYKYARTHTSEYNNYINPNFSMSNCSTYNENGTINDSCKQSTGIVNYKDYQTLIILSKTSSFLNPDCNVCADVPLQLNDGLKSEICYDTLYKTYSVNPCNGKTKIPIIDICKEKSGTSYPYGLFNNNKKNPPIKIHSIKDLQPCQEELHCNSYKFCKCFDCKVCKYKVVTPIDENTNIIYTEENYDDNHNHNNDNHNDNHNDEYSNVPFYMREHLIYLNQLKREQQSENIKLTDDAINIFGKSNPIF
jgi:hypothetical protein